MFQHALTVLVAAVLLPQAAQAQTPSGNSFLDLLKRNDEVTVIDKDGRKTIGRLATIAAESIAISGPGGTLRTFGRSDILEIRKSVPDGLGNGAVYGALLGLTGTFLTCIATVDDGFIFTGTEICSMAALVFGAPGGLVVGLVADKLHTEKVSVYRAPAGSAPRLKVGPVVTPSRVGVRVAVRLGR